MQVGKRVPPVRIDSFWYSTPDVSPVLPLKLQTWFSAVTGAVGPYCWSTETIEWKIHFGAAGVPNIPAGCSLYSSVAKSWPPGQSAARFA